MTDTATLTLDTSVLDGFWPAGAAARQTTGQWDADMNAVIAKGYNDDGVSVGTGITKGIPADYGTKDSDGFRAVRTIRQALAHTAARLTKGDDGKPTKSLDSRVHVVTADQSEALGVEAGTPVLVWRLIDRRPPAVRKSAEAPAEAPKGAKAK